MVRGGACSSTAWALVPPKPKALTPATSGPVAVHSRASVTTEKPAGARPGEGEVWCNDGGSLRWFSASTTFTREGRAAALSRCPMFVFTEPSSRSTPSGRTGNAWASERSSIGSPTAVPVPWAST
ncbi:hypothetical protein SMICM17S_02281 [Streptomyces microflavus]